MKGIPSVQSNLFSGSAEYSLYMDATVQVREGAAKVSTNMQQNDVFGQLELLAP